MRPTITVFSWGQVGLLLEHPTEVGKRRKAALQGNFFQGKIGIAHQLLGVCQTDVDDIGDGGASVGGLKQLAEVYLAHICSLRQALDGQSFVREMLQNKGARQFQLMTGGAGKILRGADGLQSAVDAVDQRKAITAVACGFHRKPLVQPKKSMLDLIRILGVEDGALAGEVGIKEKIRIDALVFSFLDVHVVEGVLCQIDDASLGGDEFGSIGKDIAAASVQNITKGVPLPTVGMGDSFWRHATAQHVLKMGNQKIVFYNIDGHGCYLRFLYYNIFVRKNQLFLKNSFEKCKLFCFLSLQIMKKRI